MNALDRIRTHGVVPVVALDDVAQAVPLGEALLRGGLACVEVTFRTSAAVGSIDRLCSTLPDLLVGAGTVTSIADAQAATRAGARFVMSPGFDGTVVEWCLANGVAVVPGVMTPTEAHRAMSSGVDVLKFFPAEPAGGVETLRALASVYPGIGFIPTGGIEERHLAGYLAEECVVACGGTWLAPREVIRGGGFGEVQRRVEAAVAIVRSVASDG